MAGDARAYWDEQAASFDDEPDHGLRDPAVRAAWASLLRSRLPAPPAAVVDLGCGTGSLAVLLASAGYAVEGLDLSDRMVAAAAVKAHAAGVAAGFRQGDASSPPFPAGSADVVLARHVLWALPDPDAALRRWTALLRDGGVLVLIEGRWSTGAGIPAECCRELVLRHRAEATVERLDDPALWGRRIDDERYLLVSRR
jgi:ubiquinone/menaquinone biosynthesis C-methylase UbiE